MDKRKRSPWKLPAAFHMDIVHEIKGEHKPVAPHRKVPEGWGKPAEPPAPPAQQPLQVLQFTTQGLRGTLLSVRSDGTLEVALPFGKGFMHPSALLLGQSLRFKGGVHGALEGVRPDAFLLLALPFGRGFMHPSSLLQ